MKRALLIASAVLLALSCSRMTSPTEPVSGAGTLRVTVTEAGSSNGIANAVIEIRQSQTGPLVKTAMTNTQGIAEISLPAGGYWIHVVPPSGFAYANGLAEVLGTQLTIGAGTTAAMSVPLSRI